MSAEKKFRGGMDLIKGEDKELISCAGLTVSCLWNSRQKRSRENPSLYGVRL